MRRHRAHYDVIVMILYVGGSSLVDTICILMVEVDIRDSVCAGLRRNSHFSWGHTWPQTRYGPNCTVL